VTPSMQSAEPRRGLWAWEKPYEAHPQLKAPNSLFHALRRLSSGSDGRAHIDLRVVLEQLRVRVTHERRSLLRARCVDFRALQVLDDTNVFLAHLAAPLNGQSVCVAKSRLLDAPAWPFHPVYIEAAVQITLDPLSQICPHFCRQS